MTQALFTTNRDTQHRKPQVDAMQIPTAHRSPSPSAQMYITVPEPMAKGTLQKKRQKDRKNHNTRKSPVKQPLLELAGQTRQKQ